MSKKLLINSIRSALSSSRFHTFEAAVGAAGENDASALDLYVWNAQVSGAFLMPLHICEVVLRNAAAEALQATYGVRWPWEQVMELSLPDPSHGYNPRRDL